MTPLVTNQVTATRNLNMRCKCWATQGKRLGTWYGTKRKIEGVIGISISHIASSLSSSCDLYSLETTWTRVAYELKSQFVLIASGREYPSPSQRNTLTVTVIILQIYCITCTGTKINRCEEYHKMWKWFSFWSWVLAWRGVRTIVRSLVLVPPTSFKALLRQPFFTGSWKNSSWKVSPDILIRHPNWLFLLVDLFHMIYGAVFSNYEKWKTESWRCW